MKVNEVLFDRTRRSAAQNRLVNRAIQEALRSLNDIIARVSARSAAMSSGNTTEVMEIARVQEASAEIQRSMDKMAIGASGIAQSSRNVSNMAQSTWDTIHRMYADIDCFKTE